MRRIIKKLERNLAEVRDYDVKNCISLGEKFEIVFDNTKEMMTLTPEELVSRRKNVSPPMNSKFDNKTYMLYGYVWNPDEVEL
jgi:predicted RNase H-like HicB family nuclease